MSKKNQINQENSKNSQKMWGGRFSALPSEAMTAINASIGIDKKMWREDIDGSLVHARMLARQNIISNDDLAKIESGLKTIESEIENGEFIFSTALEDIHLNIESRLTELVGEAGKRLHTGRSRNDQVATDFKLWVRRALVSSIAQIKALQNVLVLQAEKNLNAILPGFTHLQSAQPVSLGHHLLAYVEMLARDIKRFESAYENSGQCPLGAAALAGTPYLIDRHFSANELGFTAPMNNSMDAVASRDFALEALSAVSICMVNISRLCEELVLFSSAQFGFVKLSDDWSTGSSIMPQKRNPDAAELVRAKASVVASKYTSLLMIIKALPLTYSKDLQEDKSLTFSAFEEFWLCLTATIGMMENIEYNHEKMLASAKLGYSTATDLADWLVMNLKIPFREAHHITGAVVKHAETLGKSELCQLSLAEIQSIDERINQNALDILNVQASVNSRKSFGGTNLQNVKTQIQVWKEKLNAK